MKLVFLETPACGSRKREPIDPIAHSRVMVDPAIHDPADPIHADFGV
jgi:hypothetical protein